MPFILFFFPEVSWSLTSVEICVVMAKAPPDGKLKFNNCNDYFEIYSFINYRIALNCPNHLTSISCLSFRCYFRWPFYVRFYLIFSARIKALRFQNRWQAIKTLLKLAYRILCFPFPVVDPDVYTWLIHYLAGVLFCLSHSTPFCFDCIFIPNISVFGV